MSKQNTQLDITGMSCAACAARIEKVVNRIPDVNASVNFAAATAPFGIPPIVVGPTSQEVGVARSSKCARVEALPVAPVIGFATSGSQWFYIRFRRS